MDDIPMAKKQMNIKSMDPSWGDIYGLCRSKIVNQSWRQQVNGGLLFKSKLEQQLELPWISWCECSKHIISSLVVLLLLLVAIILSRTQLERYDVTLLRMQRALEKSLHQADVVSGEYRCRRSYQLTKFSSEIQKTGLQRATTVQLEHCPKTTKTNKDDRLSRGVSSTIDRYMDSEPEWNAFLQEKSVGPEATTEPPEQQQQPLFPRTIASEHIPPVNRVYIRQPGREYTDPRGEELELTNGDTDELLLLPLLDNKTRTGHFQGWTGQDLQNSTIMTRVWNKVALAGDHPDAQLEILLEQRMAKVAMGIVESLAKQKPGVQFCESKSDCPSTKLCVAQVCVCPVLYSSQTDSDTECTKLALGFKPGCISPISFPDLELLALQRNISLLPPPGILTAAAVTKDPLQVNLLAADLQQNITKTKLQELADFSTCAVVGSSSSLLLEAGKFGDEIDKHSAVIRFNDAPTAGLEEWVGSKTTLRIQNVIYCGFTESPGELCMRYTSKERGDHIELHSYCKKGWGKCRVVQQSPQVILYAMAYRHLTALHQTQHNASSPPTKPLRKMSAGFFGVALALHICGQVDVYGIEGGEMHYYVKGQNKHHSKQPCTIAGCPSKRSFAERHNWNEESVCLSHLHKTQIPRLLFHGTVK